MPATNLPNLGLVFDKTPLTVPDRALQDGLNFRCKNGRLESLNLGWDRFSENFTLNGSVSLIDNFFPRNQDEKLIFGTTTDLYRYLPNEDRVAYITPRYATGTVEADGTAVTGTGTLWFANVRVGDMIHFGNDGQTSPTVDWYEILEVTDDTHIVLADTGVPTPVVAGTDYTIRKLFTSSLYTTWSTDVFLNDGDSGEDLWFATNGVDPIVTWNGSTTVVQLHPELGFTAGTLAVYSNMMIYGNLVYGGEELPSSIVNSDIGLPLAAGDVGSGLSEQFVTHSGSDPIMSMMEIGDYLVLYCSRTVIPMQFIGDPLIFSFRVAITGLGPISGRAVADFGDYHEFIGADAGYTFDGVTVKEVNSHIWRNVLRQADPLRRIQTFAHFDEEQGDLIWSVPGTTDAGVGVIGATAEYAWGEHYLEAIGDAIQGSPFSKRNFPFTAMGYYEKVVGTRWSDLEGVWSDYNYAWNDQFFQAAFPMNIAGDANGIIWRINQTQTADGEPLPSWVLTNRRMTRSGRERDLLTRVYPYSKEQPYSLDVTLFMSDFLGDKMTSKGTQEFDMSLPQGQHFVTFYRRGRAFELMFGSAAGEPWILDGWDYDIVNGGLR